MERDRTLQTERLTLRPLAATDADALLAVYGDAETMRFWHHPPHASAAETAEMIERSLSVPGSCWWAICLRGEERAAGVVGYLGSTLIPGMGYILRRDLWRLGYMSEAARAALDYGFRTLGFDRVELWIHQGNSASQGLARRLGFTRRGQLRVRWPHLAEPHEMGVWGLLASEWSPELPAAAERVTRVEPILPVRDVAAAVAHYRDALGFSVSFLYGDPPTHAGVFRGEWSAQGASFQLTQAPEGQQPSPATLYLFVAEGIDSLHDELRARGAAVVEGLGTRPWGMREFTVEDRDGHQLRFGMPA